ncbi:MAG: hypothetical protein ACKO4Z_09160 [Planctomycetota bacterium]
MPDPTTSPSPFAGWGRVPDGRAARIDATAPLRGIQLDGPGGRDRLLALDLGERGSAPVVDHWVRGPDLTVVCEPRDGRLLRATVMWRRSTPTGGIDAWEAIVSAQTALLDCDATLSVVSDVEVGELLVADAAFSWTYSAGGRPLPAGVTATLARRPATSVLVAVHPVDLRRIDAEIRDSVARIECRLFASAVEKGVLLRSRVLAAIGPRSGDEAWAAALLAAFAESPAPLTT